MQEEIEFYHRIFTTPSFWGGVRKRIKILRLPKYEIKRMQNVLIEEAKPVFFSVMEQRDSVIDELTKKYFEERIETLPRRALYDLYVSYMEFKNAKGKKHEADALRMYVIKQELMYSLDGWFRGKLFNLLSGAMG